MREWSGAQGQPDVRVWSGARSRTCTWTTGCEGVVWCSTGTRCEEWSGEQGQYVRVWSGAQAGTRCEGVVWCVSIII